MDSLVGAVSKSKPGFSGDAGEKENDGVYGRGKERRRRKGMTEVKSTSDNRKKSQFQKWLLPKKNGEEA